jgi:hypothetical protein
MISKRMEVAIARKSRGGAVAQPKPMPAPTGGWVTAQNLAASKEGTCAVLTNAYATTTGIRVRGGNILYATLPGPVESMMNYVGAVSQQMFAASMGGIYPITTVANPSITPTPDITGQTSNYYSRANFATTGTYYMYAVNGTDEAQLFDGVDWQQVGAATTPIAVTGTDTSTWSHVNVYRNRLYFTRLNDLVIDYLPVDQVGGAASQLSLAGIFLKGGSVYFTATWSSESGSSALNDYLVVVSTMGEAAIFQGSFPSGPDWQYVGVYEISKPLGINGWMKAGGDIVIETERGAVPVSAARYKDPAALALDAVSRAIEPNWTKEVRERRTLPWEMAKWDSKGLFYIIMPVTSASNAPINFTGNLQTGAWSLYDGWGMRCHAIHNDQMYFGTNEGTVRVAEVSGYDLDKPYNAQIAYAWNHMGAPGNVKTIRQARADFITTYPFAVDISASTGYVINFPVAPNVEADNTPASVYDVGQWDLAVFDGGSANYPKSTRWQSVGTTGDIFAMQIQIPVGSVNTPDAELVIMHVTLEGGGLVV